MSQLSSGLRPRPAKLASVAAITAVSLTLAACGSSGSGSSGSSSTGSGSSGSNAASTKSTATKKSTSSSATVATTKVPGYGTVLATGGGSPLYLLTADPSGGSSCSGACAKQWRPLSASGKPSAGSGVTASMLSSFKRSDGTVQVLYAGHALYTHPGTSPTAVAGTASDGGIWYLVSPSGKPIKSTNGSGY